MAYVGEKQFVVVDGQEGRQYDGHVSKPPVFNPILSSDSRRMAYVAQEGSRWFMVVDVRRAVLGSNL